MTEPGKPIIVSPNGIYENLMFYKCWPFDQLLYNFLLYQSEDDESSASDEDTDPEVSFSPKSAASILSAGVGGISVLKSSAMGKVINGSR